jgi:hypothetical protein
METPSPRKHPNAFAGFSISLAAGLVIAEFQERFGITLTEPEAIGIVSLAVGVYLLIGKQVKRG